MNEGISIDEKGLYVVQKVVEVVFPGFVVESRFIAEETQLGKAAEIAALLFIAYVYMYPVVRLVQMVSARLRVVIPAPTFV